MTTQRALACRQHQASASLEHAVEESAESRSGARGQAGRVFGQLEGDENLLGDPTIGILGHSRPLSLGNLLLVARGLHILEADLASGEARGRADVQLRAGETRDLALCESGALMSTGTERQDKKRGTDVYLCMGIFWVGCGCVPSI